MTSTFVVVLGGLLVNAAAALAQKASDPTQVGDNVKNIVSPNAKAIWWVALVAGLLFMAIARKGSRVGGVAFVLIASGIAIYNPVGVASFMQGLADRVL